MAYNLKPLHHGKGRYLRTDEALKMLEEIPLAEFVNDENKMTVLHNNSPQLRISDVSNAFVLENVMRGEELYTVVFHKKLVDAGREISQDEWIALLKPENCNLPSLELYHAVISELYNMTEQEDERQRLLVEKVRRMLNQDFAGHRIMTSTRVLYSPSGIDVAVHDCGYDTEHGLDGRINGLLDEEIAPQSRCDSATAALMGTNDLGFIQQAYRWVSGKQPRLNTLMKPSQPCSRVVFLGNRISDNKARFDIDCKNNYGTRLARRVSEIKQG